MKNLDVEPEALEAFAKASEGRAERFGELQAAFLDARVARHAFGVMPASFSLAATYEEYFEACLEGLREGVAVMAAIAEGIAEEAAAYRGTDVANTDLFVPGGATDPDVPAPRSNSVGPVTAY